MRSIVVPGYEDMFKEETPKYDDVLQNISSDRVIMIIISLNAELNSEETFLENQKRLFEAITYRFSKEQSSMLNNSMNEFTLRNGFYNGEIFGRRYLLSMLLKELKRDKKDDNSVDDPMHEYDFLRAYFITVDEVNKADNYLLEGAIRYNFKLMPVLPLLWAQSMPQYEFNDSANPAFELLKVAGFLKYASEKYRIYLKEYLNLFGFKSISNYLNSVHQLANSTLNYNANEFLRKLTFIVPDPGNDPKHLKAQSINSLKKNEKFTIDDIRRCPLYETKKRGFMISDEDFYKKKIYRGALFELHKATSLKTKINFEDYKTDVSKKFFEEILFKGILKQMVNDQSEFVRFDDNKDSGSPDLYYRDGNVVFLVEFKDYLFPGTLVKGNNFGAFRKYIDERFITSDSGKPKGVIQLSNCICKIFKDGYAFDSELHKKIKQGEDIHIYPVICHTDFMFGMPGLNEYLQILLSKHLREKGCAGRYINPITMINIESFFDLSLRGGGFRKLSEMINKYFRHVNSFRQSYLKSNMIQDYLMSVSSFDEVYNTAYRIEMIDQNDLTDSSKFSNTTEIIGVTQEQIDEIL